MAPTNHSLRLVAVLVVVAMFALAGCVGVFFLHPKVAQATFPGQNGNIAYEVSDEFDSDIYTINATGGTPFNVTNTNTTLDEGASYSPDGQKIAYSGYNGTDGTGQQIYTIDASGGESFRVTHTTTTDIDPSYSPDGQKIAYSGNDGDWEIYTIDASGGEPFNVTNNTRSETDPSWGIDTTAPKVNNNTSPANNATRVSRTANVTATFSEPMNEASVEAPGVVTLKKSSGGAAVGASVTYNPTTRKVILNPNLSLARNTLYSARVTSGARDLAGNQLDQNSTTEGNQAKSWKFTTVP